MRNAEARGRSRSRVRRAAGQALRVMAWTDPAERDMGGRQGDAQPRGDQHHHGIGPAARGEELGVAGEGHARVVDDPLVHRTRDQGVEAPGQAAIAGDLEGLDDIGGVGLVQMSRSRRGADGDRVDQKGPGPLRGSGRRWGPSGSGSGAAPGRQPAVAKPGPPPPPVRLHGWSAPGAHRGPGQSRRAPQGSRTRRGTVCVLQRISLFRCRCGPRHRLRRVAGAATGPSLLAPCAGGWHPWPSDA